MAAKTKAASRILVVHWKPEEATSEIEALRDVGHDVSVYSDQTGKQRAKHRAAPPDVAVISLERLPSHGREIAQWFRTTKATGHVPVVFVGGAPDKVARARESFPEAVYCEWRGIRGALKRAAKQQPERRAEVACSTKSLWQKLGIDADATVAILGAPPAFDVALGDLPTTVTVRRQARGKGLDLVVLFPRSAADLAKRWPQAVGLLGEKRRRIWLAWPKPGKGVESEITQDLLRGFGADQRWTDVKVCRIDDTWSALQFAPRR